MRIGSKYGPLGVALGAVTALALATVAAPGAAEATTVHTKAILVERLTGVGAGNDTIGRFSVGATDLGVLWDNGSGEVLAAFGDTYDGAWLSHANDGHNGADWRSNVLLRSSDGDLADGMWFSSAASDAPNHAKQLIPSKQGGTLADGRWEETTIPTAGVSVDGRQYMSYMSVRSWDFPGEWSTNYARIAYSDDNGQTWNSTDGPTWDNGTTDDSQFQMHALERDGGYVYLFATPSGRFGSVHLARVPEDQILTKSAYRYWDGSTWSTSETSAAQIVSGQVSELSVQRDAYTGKWLMLYAADNDDVVLRTAASPTGPWSTPQTVVSTADYPWLYAPYLHPWSDNGELYFTMSQWHPYNVYLMKVRVDPSGTIITPNLVQDPSFERDSLGSTWVCTVACGIDEETWGLSGINNAWITHVDGWSDIHQTVVLEPDTNYRLSAWVRTSANNAAGYFGIRSTTAIVAETHYGAATTWTRLDVTFNSGSTTSADVFVGLWGVTETTWAQIDDVALVKE